MKSRKIKKMMWIVLGSGVVVGLVFIALLLAWSPGQPQPFRAENGEPLAGSLSEKIFVEINGTAQGMFIQSKDVRNPVLLFLHGGPGMPEYWLTQRYPTGLEEDFTVVWWEQRGAGLSYRADLPADTMTAEQFVADTLAVSRYLIERFDQEKIYLMGHSWGSYIGIQAAAQSPELYHAYIGVGQMAHQIESEQLAYAYALEQYRAHQPGPPPGAAWLIGEALTNVYVGLLRDLRGEKLSAMRFIQVYAVDRILELAERSEPAAGTAADGFNRERRFEQRVPALAGRLPAFVQGYARNRESALAVLAYLEEQFAVHPAMKQAILKLCEPTG